MLIRVKLIITLGLLVVMFQNCSQDEGLRSRQFIVKKEVNSSILIVDEEIGDNVADLPDNDIQGDDTPGSLDSKTCFQNHLSVFQWLNPTANLMSEKPVLSKSQLVTLKINTNGFSTESTYIGWSVEGSIKSNSDGSSTTSIKFLKASPQSPGSLDCYLMRVKDSATLEAGLSNTLFQNIGISQTANTLVGFVRYEEQFIACRVAVGADPVELRGMGQESTLLKADEAFVIKRGCYQDNISSPVY